VRPSAHLVGVQWASIVVGERGAQLWPDEGTGIGFCADTPKEARRLAKALKVTVGELVE